MNVFEAFPNAIEQMSIVEVDYGTITGNTTGEAKIIRVIKDEVTTADPTNSPNAATIAADTRFCMLYQQTCRQRTRASSSAVTSSETLRAKITRSSMQAQARISTPDSSSTSS